METPLSYLSIARSCRLLRIIGLYPINSASSNIKKILHRFYMNTVFFLILLYTLQEILKVYENRDDINKVIETMYLFLTYTDYIYKLVVIRKNSDELEDILQTTKGPIYNQGNIEHRAPLLNTVRQSLIIARGLSFMAVFTCFLWAVHPTILHTQGKNIELPIWLPIDANSNPFFYYAVFYMWIQTSHLALGNSTFDVFIVYLLEQCKTQISIIRLELENIVITSKLQEKEKPISYSDALEFQLKKIICHHKEVIKMAAKVQDIFGNVFLYLFLVGVWILCTSAYRMVTINPASVEFISMIFYINCILIEMFLYCYYGNELFIESTLLIDSAYAVDWLAFPVKHRRMLIFFMERIKYPIQPMAGFLVPLSNSTFVSILRSSYTFYAFLKNSDKGSV